MRLNLTAAIVAVGLCLLVAGVAQTAVTGQWRVQLIRGSTTVGQGVGATEAAAWADCQRQIPTSAPTAVYACQTMRYYATVTLDPVPPPPAAGTASLSWTPPTQNIDGSTLANLAGYRISYGISPAALTQTVQVSNPGVVAYSISNLAPGTWYFAIRAYNSAGTDSVLSDVVSKTVQ